MIVGQAGIDVAESPDASHELKAEPGITF
jgi:hypothetical protein